MTHVTCRLTAKNRDQLWNPTLGNRAWATFTFFTLCYSCYTFSCISVTQPDRTCRVAVTAEKAFLSTSFVSADKNSTVACGSRDRAWLLEAPSGQRINVSLLDLSGSSSSRTVETAPSLPRSRCLRQLGFIEDKSANRNVNICTDNTQPTIYVSRSNQLAIVLTPQQTPGNYLISAKGWPNFRIITISCLLYGPNYSK